MPPHHILLLGGNGKVSRLLTPMLLRRAWTVTSVVRDAAQVDELKRLGDGLQGKLHVLVRSLEDVKSVEQAKGVIEEAGKGGGDGNEEGVVDYVVWSAGAGGKGGPQRTYAIDRDAAIHFIRAAVDTPSVTKFVMISFITSRLAAAPWWPADVWPAAQQGVLSQLETYYRAKIAADQVLYEESKKRPRDFAAVNLRPGLLTTLPEGPVQLGKTRRVSGMSSRASVARLVELLLAQEGVRSCWLDMLDGQEEPEQAVRRCVEEGVNCIEGEPYYP
ncbi:hypothetical protein GGR50DRAFT_554684 [Xylaria sp. CBS 124048]|nr:hypothetical protein GGR50DRAFT_554684 [Xylaria sp. CBS 124048]